MSCARCATEAAGGTGGGGNGGGGNAAIPPGPNDDPQARLESNTSAEARVTATETSSGLSLRWLIFTVLVGWAAWNEVAA